MTTRWRVRWHVANALSWPLWQVKVLGDRADRLQVRILWWGERATRPTSAEGLCPVTTKGS